VRVGNFPALTGAAMKRREFLSVLGGAAAWPIVARAQQGGKIPRIGYLTSSAATGLLPSERAFLEGLRELGYVEGENIQIEYRFAEGHFERLADLAKELVRLNVDVIVAAVTQASLAAKAATRKIPIVMLGVSDPVGSKLVPSLARPGGNITGTSSQTAEAAGKTLEVLKDAVPGITRVAVLWNPENAVFQSQMLRETERAAGVLGIQLREIGARQGEELGRAFATITEEKVDGLLVLGDPTLARNRKRIVEFAEKLRLPAIYGVADHADIGGLMAYAPDMIGQFRRGAAYVDKILKGANPAELPVEQPTKFELVINMRTARKLGLTIPLPLLGRADRVIE
jgi:ABC-type uncharacterized transport system substrate-binding protein